MKLLSMALAAASLTALSACGGGSENKAANTAAEDVNVVAEDNLLDDSLAGNVAGNEADANAVDANAAAGNEAGNVQ
ncbi:MAG TPA: hypothetical protein VLK25_04990 [Allosphingosinicella sp.]|nr:hypothetical protein [Allosphingosinicella sp.]